MALGRPEDVTHGIFGKVCVQTGHAVQISFARQMTFDFGKGFDIEMLRTKRERHAKQCKRITAYATPHSRPDFGFYLALSTRIAVSFACSI